MDLNHCVVSLLWRVKVLIAIVTWPHPFCQPAYLFVRLLYYSDAPRRLYLCHHAAVRLLHMPHPDHAARGGERAFSPLEVAEVRLNAQGLAARLDDLETQHMLCKPGGRAGRP